MKRSFSDMENEFEQNEWLQHEAKVTMFEQKQHAEAETQAFETYKTVCDRRFVVNSAYACKNMLANCFLQ